MKLCLTIIDERWVGVVDLDGELYKVILFPGSATIEWRAILQPTLFVEPQSSQIREAILKAKEELDNPIMQTTHTWWNKKDLTNESFPPDLMKAIQSILKGNGGEDGSTDPI